MKYRERYIDGVVAEPSLAMLFGKSVHTALERLFQGQGEPCPVAAVPHADHLDCARSAYYAQFDTMRAMLAEDGIEAGGLLYLEGLRMIDQVAAMQLNADGASRSERWWTIPANEAHLAGAWPIVGAVDLWCPPWSQHGAVVFDFKTTVGSWSQARADRERWQPLLYAWAYARAYGTVPIFRYLVLNRTTNDVQMFDRVWASRAEFEDDLADMRFHAEEIAEAVADGNFDCTRKHGNCLECGESYTHGHECRRPARHKLTLTRNGPVSDLVAPG